MNSELPIQEVKWVKGTMGAQPDQCVIHMLIMEMLIHKMSWIPGDSKWIPESPNGSQ